MRKELAANLFVSTNSNKIKNQIHKICFIKIIVFTMLTEKLNSKKTSKLLNFDNISIRMSLSVNNIFNYKIEIDNQ